MPLMYSWENCNRKPIGKVEEEIVRDLVMMSMHVGLSEIHMGNVNEWIFRIRYLGHADVLDVAKEFTEFDCIKNWHYLVTNANTMTRKQFMRRVAGMIERSVEESMAREKERESQ
jgi:hypothetical protein